MAVFATGVGNQVNTAENIECIIKAYNPKLFPGIVTSADISETDLQNAKKLGEELAKTITKIEV